MKDSTLKLLSKSDLIGIIQSEPTWKRRAFYKVIDLVNQKITEILDEQEKLDIATLDGRIKYLELEEKYEKWKKIQDDL